MGPAPVLEVVYHGVIQDSKLRTHTKDRRIYFGGL